MGRLGSNLFQLLSSIRSFPESAHIEMISEGDEVAIATIIQYNIHTKWYTYHFARYKLKLFISEMSVSVDEMWCALQKFYFI